MSLQKEIFLLLPLQSGCLLFYFIAQFFWLESSRTSSHYFVSNLEGKHSAFLKYGVSCRFLVGSLYQDEEVPFYF